MSSRYWTRALLASCSLLAFAAPLSAQGAALPPITLGVGVQTSYVHDEPEVDDSTDRFLLNSARLYVNGSTTETIKFTFNSEFDGVSNHMYVLDALARFEFSPKFNVWAGRLLPPSDRANLYGPYYAHHWSTYTDGVQDGYPFVAGGRDNGAVYWGQFGKVKLSGGAFDGASATKTDDTVIAAGRFHIDFWDPEDGYYLNSTYYGDKNLLAIGVAGQAQGSEKKAYSFDFLLERKAGEGGAFTVEAEWAKYDKLGGYNPNYGTDDGGFVLGSYLFPAEMGKGKFEILGKFAKARFREGLTLVDTDYDQTTTELNLNYIIRQFNARVMIFYKDTRFDAVLFDDKQFGVGLQVQM